LKTNPQTGKRKNLLKEKPMRTITTIELENSDFEKLKFEASVTCNRQYDELTIDEQLMEGCYVGFSRMDMYLIKITCDGQRVGNGWADIREDGLRIQIDGDLSWEDKNKVRKIAENWFKTTQEFQQQLKWHEAIKKKIEDFGGKKLWDESSLKMQNDRREKIKTFCKEHLQLFADTKTNQKEISKLAESAGLFWKSKISFSGIGHIIWVYENHVKNK
jgi:hypothetical protein